MWDVGSGTRRSYWLVRLLMELNFNCQLYFYELNIFLLLAIPNRVPSKPQREDVKESYEDGTAV